MLEIDKSLPKSKRIMLAAADVFRARGICRQRWMR